MEKIQPGKYVELVYEIFVVEDGKESSVFKFTDERPDGFVFGADPTMIPGFMNNILDLEQDAAFDFTLEPADAFGEKDPEMVAELEKKIFFVDGKFDSEHVFPGAIVPLQTAEGYRMDGFVESVSEDKVVVDFNHQLAGETIRYVGKVKLVRDATPEEMQPHHHHCGCGCEDCHDGECGDGCHGGNCDCEDCQK